MKKSIIKNKIRSLILNKPVRMHMPGHKGKKRNLRFDITEIDGADNLHNPEGIIKEVQNKISEIYNSDNSFLLVNGSTTGIQASLLSSLSKGDKVLIPINAHRSVYPALSFSQAEPIYYEPERKEIGMVVTPELVEELINNNPGIKVLLVVSPDYYGNISNIKDIKKVTDKYNIVLIVDEAHGAHLNFLDEKLDAVSAGADYVIQSTHKILGAPTQSSLLHTNNKVNPTKVRRFLSYLESSSPSYFLMSGIEEAIDEAHDKAKEVFSKIYKAYDAFIQNQSPEDPFKLVTPDGKYDKSKFFFTFPGNYNIRPELIKYGIIPELIGSNYVLFMTGIGTSQRDLNRLFGAVNNINQELKTIGYKPKKNIHTVDQYVQPYETVKELNEVLGKTGKRILLKDAKNQISTDFIIPYPPGIPYLIPGSIIKEKDINLLSNLLKQGILIHGLEKDSQNNIYIEILDENNSN